MVVVSQIVEQTGSFEDGLAVSRHVMDAISGDEARVNLSFRGVDTITTSFLNGLFVTLVREHGRNFLFSRVHLTDVGRQPRQMIVDRFLKRLDESEKLSAIRA